MKSLIIIFCCAIFIISCKKSVAPIVQDQIFTAQQNTVSNGQALSFTLKYKGIYTLTLVDSIQSTILTREQFNGIAGLNKLNIYTRTIQSKYLYLILEDSTKTQIGKTTLIVN